ncbi:hypothetical protein N7490_007436 [Penicillium lividum]|nr:hypothetical protein N7490_007436 [Penicillium lividum]
METTTLGAIFLEFSLAHAHFTYERETMALWADLHLWAKLSLSTDIIVAYSVSACRRWRKRGLERRQQEEEADLYPMLKSDDIPFGVWALQSDVKVSDIWISRQETPCPSPCSSSHPPETPTIGGRSPTLYSEAESTPPSAGPVPINVRLSNHSSSLSHDDIAPSHISMPLYSPLYSPPPTATSHHGIIATNMYRYEPYRPGVYTSATIASAPVTPSTFNRRSETFASLEKRASFHNRVLPASQSLDSKRTMSGTSDQDRMDLGSLNEEYDPRLEAEQNPAPRIRRTIRSRSSEDFRRKMSKIFNDRIHMNTPSERLEFDPTLRETGKHKFRSSTHEGWDYAHVEEGMIK